MKHLLSVFTLLFFLLVSRTGAQESGVSEARFARLSRGINLAYWFWYTPEDIDNRFSDADFALLRDMGLTFVRVPIDLGFVMDQTSPDLLNHTNLAYLDRGIDRLLAHDLAVLIDLHSTSIADSDNANYSAALEDDTFVSLFTVFWRSFAAHLSTRDPEMLFLGPMNEPVFLNDPAAWPPIQEQLIAAIRENAPDHTIIATAAPWSGLDGLLALEPLADPNIVYDFHFYEPFPFTHQGAGWSMDEVKRLRDIPYPSSPSAVESVLTVLDNPGDQSYIRQYGDEQWNAVKVEEYIAQAATWARQHEARLLCGEFGVYSKYAPPADRARWTQDVRTAFEKYGIGWAMWEYDGSFGMITRASDGSPVVDAPIAEALGLNLTN